MELTKKTTVSWKTRTNMLNPVLIEKRREKLQEMIFNEKTDGIAIPVDDLTRSIHFTDQAAAEEWINFIQATAKEQGIQVVSTEISDL